MSNYTLVKCPHCQLFIFVYKKDYNCKIFRHGTYKNKPTKQINPHLSKIECDKLKAEDKIIGCGKPFKIVYSKPVNKPIAIKCDYI